MKFALSKNASALWGFGHTLAAWNIGKWYVGSMIENMHLIYEHLAVHSKNICIHTHLYYTKKNIHLSYCPFANLVHLEPHISTPKNEPPIIRSRPQKKP